MGNTNSNLCAGPVAAARPLDTIVVPTEAEILSYVSEVKQVVEDTLESPEARCERYIKAFKPDHDRLRLCTQSFVEELELGLQNNKARHMGRKPEECSFKCLDSYVPRAPSGAESGVYYALDFGGSNFRVVRVVMDRGKFKITAKKASLSDCDTGLQKGVLDPKATATQLFDFFAMTCEQFMRESGDMDKGKEFMCGFTFSYPCAGRRLDSAALMVWTKGFETGRDTNDPVEGCDVGELLNRAFARRRIPLKVNCVCNDTVGTLISCAYSLPREQPPCAIGLILGTGMNACYLDDRAVDWGYVSNIINIECGNFNRDTLPRTNVDFELDFDDVGGRGRQHLEKMCSGAYLGDLCRRICVKVFQYKAPPRMWQRDSFSSEDASTIIGDKSEKLVVVQKKTRERWSHTFDHTELEWIKAICTVVFERAAAMAALIIAGAAIKSGRLQEAMGGVTAGVDGSLYKCNPFLREDLRRYLNIILGEKQANLVNVAFADDGSGLGAAIVSAVADS